MCDDNLKFRNIYVGYPGSVHDSRVYRNSSLYRQLPSKCNDKYILGDSGYPCLRNLLTPYKARGVLNQTQINYNTKLSKSRIKIEHAFGLLKQKFRQLYHLKLRNIVLITHFIRACCVLHNMSLNDQFEWDIDSPTGNSVEAGSSYLSRNNSTAGADRRNEIAQLLASRNFP